MPRYINADALEAYIKGYACIPCKFYGADKDGLRCDFCGFGFCLEGIKRHTAHDAPTVDAEPVRHGHWIKERNPMMYQSYPYVWVCDQCGTAFYYKTPYCGECGAKMDEEEK